jgi:hypothetical protein
VSKREAAAATRSEARKREAGEGPIDSPARRIRELAA